MVQEYYNLEKAAEVLGVYPAELNEMREKGKVRAFRDGSGWKFKKEEIDDLAVELRSKKAAGPDKTAEDDSQDVLLSEVELGESDPSASGTVIGSEAQSPEDSDIKLASSDIGLGTGEEKKDGGSFEELDLTIEEDVQLEDSQLPLASAETGEKVAGGSGDSAIELAEGLEDDDLVLGSGGSGSDITIGQDSGISLVDPHDSGLSLDEPLELASDDESLALGEDDMLTLSEDADTESPTELKADDDFLLTPLEEGADEEDSESGSQVIALDDALGDEAATMVAGGAGGGMAAMLDEEVGGADAGLAVGPLEGASEAVGAFGAAQPAGAALAPGAAALPESPYGKLAMIGLTCCLILLLLSGMMAYDLMRNMWSWGGTYSVTSSLMDMVVGLFGG
ncbi:MAG TPA: helix-turn-helix domain-containing protein [Thermoguttaceae bacterium]|nr:helix-turn-helix domain-containing protein [Thermoguttaceae bacterium]